MNRTGRPQDRHKTHLPRRVYKRWDAGPPPQQAEVLATAVDATDLAYLDRFISIKARARWNYDGRVCPFEEYLDAGHEALVRCLERFTPQPGCTFRSFARVAIQWDIHMAWRRYRRWKWGRGVVPRAAWITQTLDIWLDAETKLAHLPPRARGYRHVVLEGQNDADYARAEGISKKAVYSRLRAWRAWA